jgi:hypothetical protein
MKPPTACALWTDPEPRLSGPLSRNFELLQQFEHESHWSRALLRCRECGQRYVYEFYEEIDWADGEDPQYRTWVPVDSDAEVDRLRQAGPGGLAGFRPCLRRDWPKGAPAPTVFWVRE